MQKKKLRWLESMRGLACLIVLFAHILSVHPMYGRFASGCGKIGVWLFFILSGFLLQYQADTKEFTVSKILPYYWNKFLRLYPVYVVGLLLAKYTGLVPDGASIVRHLLLQEGVHHFWYMPVIIKFYLCAPFILLLYKMLNNKRVYIAILLIILFVVSFVFPFTQYIENSIWLRWYVPVFIMGMLLSFLLEFLQKQNRSLLGEILVVIGAVMIILPTPIMRFLVWNIEPSGYLQNKYLYMGIAWCLILIGIAKSKYICNLLETCSILQVIGSVSFWIYILHYIILHYLVQFLEWKWNACITFILSIVLSLIMNMIESLLRRKTNGG